MQDKTWYSLLGVDAEPLSTKILLLSLPSNPPTTFSKLKTLFWCSNIRGHWGPCARRRPMGQNLGIWVKIVFLNTILPLIWFFLLENRWKSAAAGCRLLHHWGTTGYIQSRLWGISANVNICFGLLFITHSFTNSISRHARISTPGSGPGG